MLLPDGISWWGCRDDQWAVHQPGPGLCFPFSELWGSWHIRWKLWCLHFSSAIQVHHAKCLQTVVLEKTLESPLDCKEIQPVNPKGNQSWIFIERTDVEAETPILWPPDAKNWLLWKDPDAGKNWRWEEKEMTEDEMAGWHQWLSAREFEQTPGDSEGQGSLACCSPWGYKELGMTERLNNNHPCTLLAKFQLC